jgi:hypothetical protein
MDCNLQILKIDRYANFVGHNLGMDCEQHCVDHEHYRRYPHQVQYHFNELGFRDCSMDRFQGNEILAIGDSFTLGLGVAQQHAWPKQLADQLGYPVLNFSLNGASNDWMTRKTQQLLNYFSPQAIVVHYTFSHRRERPHINWTDDERTECEPFYTDLENYQNWQQAFDYFSSLSVPVVHSFITNWHNQSVDYDQLPGMVIPPITKIDLARDGFHYGVKTNQQLAMKITSLLAV